MQIDYKIEEVLDIDAGTYPIDKLINMLTEVKKKYEKDVLIRFDAAGYNNITADVVSEVKVKPKVIKPKEYKGIVYKCPYCNLLTDGKSKHGDCLMVIDKRGGWRQLGVYDG